MSWPRKTFGLCSGFCRKGEARQAPQLAIVGKCLILAGVLCYNSQVFWFRVRSIAVGRAWGRLGWAFRPFFICAPRMELQRVIEQAVEGLGYELVDFETSPRARMLRVFIDGPKGIAIEDCTRVSNHLTRLFAVENIDYDRLEVSSPGL